MRHVPDSEAALIVTSPPYPMIEMWDGRFVTWDPEAGPALAEGDGLRAWELMHRCLDRVWKECTRILIPGGTACINIGDAVRTAGGRFRLYPNHTRIVSAFLELGFDPLPIIHWRKSTNAPNKFMGSGMLPAGAYVTLEHEYILIFRKGERRRFTAAEDKMRRRESALFWEERNRWYSDSWTLAGEPQTLPRAARERSGAFPWELAYRLILMYSAAGEVVADPFLGTGSTMAAAAAAGRSSIGYEVDGSLRESVEKRMGTIKEEGNRRILRRIEEHGGFCEEHAGRGKHFAGTHKLYGFPVKTGQETDMVIRLIDSVQQAGEKAGDSRGGCSFSVIYREWENLHSEETRGDKPVQHPLSLSGDGT